MGGGDWYMNAPSFGWPHKQGIAWLRGLGTGRLVALCCVAYVAAPVALFFLLWGGMLDLSQHTSGAAPFLWMARAAMVALWIADLGLAIAVVAAVQSVLGRIAVGALLASILAAMATCVGFLWLLMEFLLFPPADGFL